MSTQNPTKRNNSMIPSKGSSGQQITDNGNAKLANNLDRLFEDFRTSFNQLMTPYITSPLSTDAMLPVPFFPDLTQVVPGALPSRYPVLDVVDEGETYSVTAELPGFTKENVEVQVNDDVLYLTAQVEAEKKKGGRYMSHERAYSSFQRDVQFPEHILPNKVEGTMKDGVLQLRIPKKEPTSSKFSKVALK